MILYTARGGGAIFYPVSLKDTIKRTILKAKKDQSPVEILLESLDEQKLLPLKGMNGAIGAMTLASLALRSELNVLLTVSVARARELAEMIEVWLGNHQSHRLYRLFPERESIYDHTAADPEIVFDRLAALSARIRGGGLIILPLSELLRRYFAPEKWLARCFAGSCRDPAGK